MPIQLRGILERGLVNSHAYLIAAHHEPYILRRLLMLLDDERNDIYLHIDARAKKLDPSEFQGSLTKSRLICLERSKVNWGGFSMVRLELDLLTEAVKEDHTYYHLISGVDLPLRSQDHIHLFFEEHSGKEFIQFDTMSDMDYRLKYYYPLQEIIGRRTDRISENVNKLSKAVQNKMKIDRLRPPARPLRYGSQWFSITHELATFVVKSRNDIARTFRSSLCGDESFLHTLVWDTPFRDRLYRDPFDQDYRAVMRYVDWKRGTPYTFRDADFEDLVRSPYLFARKFSTQLDPAIVDRIYDFVMAANPDADSVI